MRISKVKAHLLTYQLRRPFVMQFVLGKRTVHRRHAMLIEVNTDEGITGWGSGDPGEMGNRNWKPSDFAALINRKVSAVLQGESPLDRDHIWTKMAAESGLKGAALTQCFGGVDIALWDIAGKVANRPICDLIGRRRQSVRAYASAGMYMPADGYVAEAREMAGAGFTAYKMRPGVSPAADMAAVEAVRSAEPDLALLVDSHTWWRAAPDIYTRSVIFDLAKSMDGLSIHWLEDPLDYRDMASYVELTALMENRVSTGENEQTPDDHIRLIDNKACDTVIVDVRLAGGITKCLEVARHANAAGLEYAAHSFSDMVSQAASAHIMLTVENPALFEYPTYACARWRGMYDNELVTALVDQEIPFADGFVTVSGRPGLGLEPLPDIERRFPYQEGYWTTWESPDGRLIAAQ
ncbi:MAG: mandelate racemase/muconate lactonizing enzyme family protein [Acidobacteria bacterium]|nr:mandelate racemase/muconate lactonizing enzyme family protein [Acidobacteriota bacterium]